MPLALPVSSGMDHQQAIPEILLVDKPKGISSFDVIRRLRRRYDIKKMGHSGTLDPLATGLMIIGVGKGTKKLNEYIKLPKVYQATILLGKKTTTGDMEGDILDEKEVLNLDLSKVKDVLEKITGKITLPVPIYSAIKVSGQPLYKKARKGEKIEPPKKEMEIFWVKLKSQRQEGSHYILELELKVASGTYIRSIAEEIGVQLGYPATLKGLRRTQIGDFSIAQPQVISDI